MNVCIDATELRHALADIDRAERAGFLHCLAVLEMRTAGPMLSDNRMRYSDLLERAHPTDGRFDWGRFQNVSGHNTFDSKRQVLVPNEPLPTASDSVAGLNLVAWLSHCESEPAGEPGPLTIAAKQASFCLRSLLPNDPDAQMTVGMLERALGRG